MRPYKLAIFVSMLSILIGCASTHKYRESGRDFSFKPEPRIIIGKTTKKQIFDTYGQPVSMDTRGKYHILKYHYESQSFKSKGINPLSFVPVVGTAVDIAKLSSDQDHTKDTIREWKTMVFYIDLVSGVVKDYYYHDHTLKGQDESESLCLASMMLKKKGGNDNVVETLEKAVSLNPNNHRALNSLAWELIDLGMDINKGVEYAEKAVKIFPDSPYNNGTLGIGYFKKGDLDKAEKYLQEAINLFPVYAPQDYKALQHDKTFLETVKKQQKS